MLVEDNVINREIASEILASAGAEILYAENGAEAVKLVVQERDIPDLVLMDIQMPVMNGYEACKNIREYHNADKLPIIAMTAHAFREEQEKSFEAGMNAHITKTLSSGRI